MIAYLQNHYLLNVSLKNIFRSSLEMAAQFGYSTHSEIWWELPSWGSSSRISWCRKKARRPGSHLLFKGIIYLNHPHPPHPSIYSHMDTKYIMIKQRMPVAKKVTLKYMRTSLFLFPLLSLNILTYYFWPAILKPLQLRTEQAATFPFVSLPKFIFVCVP